MKQRHPTARIITLSCLSVFGLLLLAGCGSGKRVQLEQARVHSILVNSRAFATDHEGSYPSNLADLHPRYIDLATNFYSPPNRAADQAKAFYYRPGLKVGDKIDEPLVISPHVIKGKVSVGYLGGFVRKMEFEDAQKILGKGGWIQEAPPIQ